MTARSGHQTGTGTLSGSVGECESGLGLGDRKWETAKETAKLLTLRTGPPVLNYVQCTRRRRHLLPLPVA